MIDIKSKIIDDLTEYGSQCYAEGKRRGRADAIEEFRKYLKTVVPCEMPQEIWNMGVDNTCDRMMKEKKNE